MSTDVIKWLLLKQCLLAIASLIRDQWYHAEHWSRWNNKTIATTLFIISMVK